MSNAIVLSDLYDFMIDKKIIIKKQRYERRCIRNYLLSDTRIHKDGLVAGFISIARLYHVEENYSNSNCNKYGHLRYNSVNLPDVTQTKYHFVPSIQHINKDSIKDLCTLISSKMDVYSFYKFCHSTPSADNAFTNLLTPHIYMSDAAHFPLKSKKPFVLLSMNVNKSSGKYARKHGNVNMDIYENTKKLLGEL